MIYTNAQSFKGLWAIDTVMVGDQAMTPHGKWIRINNDCTFDSGNGWTKNSEGWLYFSKDSSTLKPVSFKGIEDPYGNFQIQYLKKKMKWRRLEDSILVTVTLSRIDEIPSILSDKILGLWEVKSTNSVTTLHFRPDGSYNESINRETESGYYFIHPHSSRLTLIPDHRKTSDRNYQLFDECGMLSIKSLKSKDARKIELTSIHSLPH